MPPETHIEKRSSTGEMAAPDVRRFGSYYLVRKLAEGGMAEIFLAKQVGAEGFERNVVIKRMLPHLSAISDFVGMFLDEARLAARLAHQNIVQINDLGLADGCYYICMEYLAGEDFSTMLRTSGKRGEYLPIPIVAKVIADAARGLHFAHEFADESGRCLNIVHRDISPSNIYVTYQGQVKVLDFGIAKAESRVTQTTAGIVKGKYMYMSPEQARGEAVDRRSDVFSLGVSLYEALTHIRPFAKDNDLAILNAVLKNEFTPPRTHRPDIPVPLEAIILKAMAGKREDRFSSAGEMAAALDGFITRAADGAVIHQVPMLMRTLFGEERIMNKTRVPSLTTLAQSGVNVPGYAAPGDKSLVPTQMQNTAATESATRVGEPESLAKKGSSGAKKPASGRSKGAFAAVAVVGMLAAAGAAWQLLQPVPARITPPVPPVAVAPPVTPPVVDPIPAPNPTVPPAQHTPVTVATPPPNPSPPAEEQKVPEPKVRPRRSLVQLEAEDVERVVGKNRATIMKCFETHKDSLTKEEGLTNVRFTILGSGQVTGANVGGDLEGTDVARCLEKRVAQLKFPAHRDKELTLSLPLKYQVGR